MSMEKDEMEKQQDRHKRTAARTIKKPKSTSVRGHVVMWKQHAEFNDFTVH